LRTDAQRLLETRKKLKKKKNILVEYLTGVLINGKFPQKADVQ